MQSKPETTQVKLSPLAIERGIYCYSNLDRLGTVIPWIKANKNQNIVRVLWEWTKTPTIIHRSFIEEVL